MSTQHGKMKVRAVSTCRRGRQTHAIPLTVDEFALVQRHYPIVFSVGDKPVPIALMGLNEGVNVFLDDDGRPLDPQLYIPAYVRRYPFLLARLRPGQRRAVAVLRSDGGRGRRVRRGRAAVRRRPAERSDQRHPRFCEQFEAAGQRTAAFMEELTKSDLLMDGEVAIQPEGFEQPFVYRGFRMVDEEKLRELARRRAAQDEPERHAAADLRAPLLAERDPRRVRPPDAAGQGAAPGAAAGARADGSEQPSFGGGRELAAEQRFAKLDGKRLDEAGHAVEPGPGLTQHRVEVAAAVDLELERMHAARRTRVTLDDVAAGERIVEPAAKPQRRGVPSPPG